tara:strand:+ start:516 stop:662 length:147 start_codon:yes stop_codon:yes gene_type:complete
VVLVKQVMLHRILDMEDLHNHSVLQELLFTMVVVVEQEMHHMMYLFMD